MTSVTEKVVSYKDGIDLKVELTGEDSDKWKDVWGLGYYIIAHIKDSSENILIGDFLRSARSASPTTITSLLSICRSKVDKFKSKRKYFGPGPRRIDGYLLIATSQPNAENIQFENELAYDFEVEKVGGLIVDGNQVYFFVAIVDWGPKE